MSDEPDVPNPLTKLPRRAFARKLAPLAPDAAKRQGQITTLAWKLLGRDAAIAFLNTHDDALGGRPLDLATADQDGCEAIERAIRAHAPKD
jgi:hypothetical protein